MLFAKFIRENPDIDKIVNDNFVYIHVNFKSRRDELSQKVSRRLGNAGRFGFPVLVVLNTDGSVLHIQNSSYLEEGKGYDRGKVLDFFKQWTPAAVRGERCEAGLPRRSVFSRAEDFASYSYHVAAVLDGEGVVVAHAPRTY